MNKQKLKEIQDKFLTGELYHTDIIADILEALLDEPKAVKGFIDREPDYPSIKPEPVTPVKWRTEKGGFYYYINDMGSIYKMKEEGHHINDYQHLTGNYYQTKEEAEQALEVIKAKGRLMHSHYALTGGFTPSKDYFEYSLEFKNQEGIDWDSPFRNYILNAGDIYYICVIDKWFKNKNQFEEFIKENEKDLRLVFNIND